MIRIDGKDGREVLLLSVGEVAVILSCSSRHVWTLLEKDKICLPIRLGRLVRWRKSDIEKWVASLPVAPKPPSPLPSQSPTQTKRRGRPRVIK
ncbi:MAG: helix-turn-helix transcriptional regulator [Acidiferrobacter sp.]